MAATTSVGATGNPMIDGLLSGTKWAISHFTFSFPGSGAYYGSGYGRGENLSGFEAFNNVQKTAVRSVLNQYAAVANVTFAEMAETASSHAELRFAETSASSTAFSYYPTTRAEGGDAWFNHSDYNAPQRGNYAYTTFLHEIGHSFGLKHPHEATGTHPAMPSAYDSMEYTVMSYRSYARASASTGYTNETWGYAQSLMMADIAALQKMYGANYKTNSGNTAYAWSPTTGEMFVNGQGQGAPGGNKIFLTVWDGGGTDTYDFSKYATNLTISLEPGGWTTTSSAQLAKLHYDGSRVAVGNIANALLYNGDKRSLIENAIGGADNDVIGGNAAANTLNGSAGIDRVTYETASRGVTVDLKVSVGIEGSTRDTLLNFEDVTGSRFNDKIGGTSAANVLDGLQGTDTVSYYASTRGVLIDLNAKVAKEGATRDTILNFENANGSGFDDAIGGTSGTNLLDGLGGNDTVSYYAAATGVAVDLRAKTATEGAVRDTILNFENVNGSSFADVINGDHLANTLNGLAGSDWIEGGAAGDILTGGAGDDTFVFRRGEAAGDIITDFEAGDTLRFEDFGPAATLVQVGPGQYQIVSPTGSAEVITFSNGAVIQPTDYLLV